MSLESDRESLEASIDRIIEEDRHIFDALHTGEQ